MENSAVANERGIHLGFGQHDICAGAAVKGKRAVAVCVQLDERQRRRHFFIDRQTGNVDTAVDERLPQISMYWEKYQDVVLLVFIVLSVFLTSWLDVGLVKLTHLDPEQKASVRLISVFYIVLILLYIRFIYEDTNYDGLILYFLTLTVGRFLYFDFTVKSFLETMRGVLENLPLLVIMSAYSGFVCWYGFHVGFLLKSNGVILSTFLAHLFMDCSIFLLHKTGILKHVIRKI